MVPLARFIGTWIGAGAGEYPTIDGFAYGEEIELRPVPGKPILAYRSATSAAEDGRSLHGESGWLRIVGDGAVELIVAQGPGVVEIAEGFVEEGEILLRSTLVGGSATAKLVTATERHYRVEGDTLSYDIAMAAVGQPLTHHLQARLHRTR
ncbi:MAG: FABP family protein [Actinomycetota bacterium]|nr:FABP family protein [Actinomycetota bacterium]